MHLLLEDRIEHTLHGRLYILDRIVDDLVETHIDVLLAPRLPSPSGPVER